MDDRKIIRPTGHVPEHDSRDADYPLDEAVARVADGTERTRRKWRVAKKRFTQEGPSCTGFAAANYLRAGPVRNMLPAMARALGVTGSQVPYEIWGRAQEIAYGQRNPNSGVDYRETFKVTQQIGMIESYHHVLGGWGAEDADAKAKAAVDQIVQALLYVGPVVIGTPFPTYAAGSGSHWPSGRLEGMEHDSDPGGYHAYVLFGVNTRTKIPFVWAESSWGGKWGVKPYRNAVGRGCAKVALSDLRALFRWMSRATIAVERKT